MEEARERVKAEEAMISMLGLLVYACSENGELAQALTTAEWLRVLLAVWHHGSPRCTRLSMRLLAKVLPLCEPKDAVVPDPSRTHELDSPFPTARHGQPLIPFLLCVVGRELLGHGHHLAFGHASWRPATAWQPIVDGSVSLLRRLLLSEVWRPALLDALTSAMASVPELLEEDAEACADARSKVQISTRAASLAMQQATHARAYAAVTAFSVLGGHLWCVCPGARVAVHAAVHGTTDAPQQQHALEAATGGARGGGGTSSTVLAGTVLFGGCGASEYAVVVEGTARGWRAPLHVPAERVVARPQVALAPSILRKHAPPPGAPAPPTDGFGRAAAASSASSSASAAGWLSGYVALLPDSSASTPLGALLRSRALPSLQWLSEDAPTLRLLLTADLFPLLVASAVRPSPLGRASSDGRDAIARHLINIETAARELDACRRCPRAAVGNAPAAALRTCCAAACRRARRRSIFCPRRSSPRRQRLCSTDACKLVPSRAARALWRRPQG